jgi:diguanylate cyclase (GGDEF)-like protein
VKSEQGKETKSTRKAWAGWFKDAQGGPSAARTFMAVLLLALAGALVAGATGVGVWPTAVLTAILGAALVHTLIVTPLARDYEAQLRARPRIAGGTMDALTRIPNRRGITTSLIEAMSYANRYSHPLSAALVDLDLLRNINRELGRKGGDKALQAVAAVFTDTLRMPDHAGRYGDEEFLLILPNTTLKNATAIAERIREGVENADCNFNGKKIPVAVSIGVSQFHKGEDLERFLARVDKALAAAKASGRNRVVAERRAAAKGSNRGTAERRTAAAR